MSLVLCYHPLTRPVNQWDAHLLTKQHRQSAAREKAQADKAAKAKRRSEAEREEGAKRARVEQEGGDDSDDDAGPSLPAGFFSAGNKPSVGEEEEAAAPTPAPAAPKPTGDAELDDFLASLNDDDDDAPAAPAQPAATAPARRKGLAYKKTEDAPGVASYAAAPVLLANGAAEEEAPEPEEPEESETEKRARLEREEREEIVARLEDEQRAQWVACD